MSELKVNSIKGLASDLPENLKPVTASAWVNFNGTGVVAIRDSFNVSSITDNGVGNYTVNFLNSLSNENYVSSLTVSDSYQSFPRGSTKTTTNYIVQCTTVAIESSATFLDAIHYDVIIFGGQ
jgi:hypothetical protein